MTPQFLAAMPMVPLLGRCPVWAVVLVLAVLAGCRAESSVHTVFPTECTSYFTWQSMGMMLSHRLSKQKGALTRILSCTHEDLAKVPKEELELLPTHVTPSYTHHPRNGDLYSAYNKPVAVIDWLARTDVKEEYVLIIDADMIMLSPFVPEVVGAAPGWAVSAYFAYMKGVNNELALKHVPEVAPRNDTLAGPRGRRGDMVGGFTLMHREDLRRVAPLWLKYTEDVRFDPDAWTLSGDHYSIHKGDQPWISEMYGYSYACSKADVWHKVDHTAMLYPGYAVTVLPKVLHYGLKWTVAQKDWSFDKHWHFDFQLFTCPPWDLSPNPAPGKKGGLFPHPPDPDSLVGGDTEVLRDLLSLQPVIVLNAAFCERHERVCPASEELSRECGTAKARLDALQRRMADYAGRLPDPCRDTDKRCAGWAASGECQKNSMWMSEYCPVACDVCKPRKATGKAAGKAAGKTGEGKQDPAPDLQDKEAGVATGVGVLRGSTTTSAGDASGGGVGTTGTATKAAGEAKTSAKTADSTDGADLAKKAEETKESVKKQASDAGGSTKLDPERVARLRTRCTRQPHWSMGAVKACLSAADRGDEYTEPGDLAHASGNGAAVRARASTVVRDLGERTRRIAAGSGAVAGSVMHAPGTAGLLLWALVLLVLLVALPRVRRTLTTPMSSTGSGLFLFRTADKGGRSE